jgi:hypothetical protein
MNRGAKNTSIHIHHEPMVSKEFGENLVEIRGLPDVPQRLGMVHRNNAVELRCAAVPRPPVSKVSANERGDLANGPAGDACRDHISYYRVTFGMELIPVVVLDPGTDWKIQRL